MKDTFKIDIVADERAFSAAMDIRRAVFVQEFGIPEYLEFDGNDFSATHFIAFANEKPIGTMRIRYFNGFVKFERMCVLSSHRKTDISEALMRRAMTFAAEKGYEKAYGVCKKELMSRWHADGFMPIPDVEPVRQNGMTLIPIYCRLEKPHNALTMQTPAEILNAKEGFWNEANMEFVSKSEKYDFNRHISDLLGQVRVMKEIPDKKPQTVPYNPNYNKVFHEH